MHILIVDDEALARARLRTLLADCQAQQPQPRYTVAEAAHAAEALALEFGDGITRSVEIEHDEMRLAVLLNLVGEAAKAPGFGLHDLTLILFDDLGGVFSQRIYLCL